MFSFTPLVFDGEKKESSKYFMAWWNFMLSFMFLSDVNIRFQIYTESNLSTQGGNNLDYYVVYETIEFI